MSEVELEQLAAWKAINDLIVPGELQGNGCDKLAERNGLILAANALFGRMTLPVLFEINKQRGTLLQGNAIQLDKGTVIAVGHGQLKVR